MQNQFKSKKQIEDYLQNHYPNHKPNYEGKESFIASEGPNTLYNVGFIPSSWEPKEVKVIVARVA